MRLGHLQMKNGLCYIMSKCLVTPCKDAQLVNVSLGCPALVADVFTRRICMSPTEGIFGGLIKKSFHLVTKHFTVSNNN
jgi:hypothetical protein